jgi:hypothetical protein
LKLEQDAEFTRITFCQLIQLRTTLSQRRSALATSEQRFPELQPNLFIDPASALRTEKAKFSEEQILKAQAQQAL